MKGIPQGGYWSQNQLTQPWVFYGLLQHISHKQFPSQEVHLLQLLVHNKYLILIRPNGWILILYPLCFCRTLTHKFKRKFWGCGYRTKAILTPLTFFISLSNLMINFLEVSFKRQVIVWTHTETDHRENYKMHKDSIWCTL